MTNRINSASTLTNTPFTSKPGFATMLRGPMVTFDEPNDQGHEPAPAPELAPQPEPEAAPEPAPAEPNANGRPSDAEARLLRDVMKHKTNAQQATAQAQAANAALAAYNGVDPERVRQLVAAADEADRLEAERRGEYERIVQQMREQNEQAIAERETALTAANERIAAFQAQVDELTLGRSFADSKFVSQNTLLSPAKARQLYGAHFDVVEGEQVAYDKPRGAKNRTPLVDAQGNHLNFEAAIEKIIKADPDFETIGRAKMRPGSGSAPSDSATAQATAPKSELRGVHRIKASLAKKSK